MQLILIHSKAFIYDFNSDELLCRVNHDVFLDDLPNLDDDFAILSRVPKRIMQQVNQDLLEPITIGLNFNITVPERSVSQMNSGHLCLPAKEFDDIVKHIIYIYLLSTRQHYIIPFEA